jgi:hypothetical protein|tara:strand:- start:535 stop:636 length:102 start_codon:yes stop_codon:yes gene_type:complete
MQLEWFDVLQRYLQITAAIMSLKQGEKDEKSYT